MPKQIGIVGSVIRDIFGVPTPYMHFCSKFGNVHILTPDTGIINLDLLILKGGEDLSPANYGQAPKYILSNSNPFLEEFDNEKLPRYIEKKTPIFGICRGMQSINIYFGGTLDQHIHGHTKNGEDREELTHNVRPQNDKKAIFGVNSMHHQAINELGQGLEVLLEECSEKGKMTGIIEAVKHKELPIIGVQWHPEEIMDEFSINAIKSLLN